MPYSPSLPVSVAAPARDPSRRGSRRAPAGADHRPGQALPAQGWSWNSDGLVPLYVRWAGGQPNDGDGTENATEQCVYSSTSTFWQDEVCTALFSRFTCRR